MFPGTQHGFCFPERAVYDTLAAEETWVEDLCDVGPPFEVTAGRLGEPAVPVARPNLIATVTVVEAAAA